MLYSPRKSLCSLCKRTVCCFTTCLLPFSAYCADIETQASAQAPVSIKTAKKKEVSSTTIEHIEVVGLSHLQTIDKISGVNDSTINKKADLGPLGNVKLQNVPFSVMKTPHAVIMNQQVRNIDKATEYMPSVQMEARSDPALTRMVNRGFEADIVANSRIDGMNVLLMTPYATEQFKNVTVLNGMAGAIYGPENPAGVFEMTQKRPTSSPYLNLNFNYDSAGAPMESLDGSYSMGPVAVRLNMLNQTGTGYVKGSHMWRDMISGNIDIHLTKKTVLELDASQYSMGLRGYPGYFSVQDGATLPDAPSLKHRGYGQSSAGGNYSTSMGMAKLKHEFNDHWRLKLGGLYQDSSRNVFGVNNNILAPKGAGCGASACIKQTISTPTNGQDFQTWSNSAYLNGEFETGAILKQKITHHVNIGSNGYSLDNFAPISADPAIVISPKGGVPFYNPEIVNNAGQTRKYGNRKAAHTQQQSLIVGDSIDIGKYATIMTELSWGWIRQENYKWKNNSNQYSGGQKVNAAFSPSVGAVIHPVKNVSLYFNWGQSVQAGPIASAGLNQNDILPVIHSEQFEGGIKYIYKDRLQLNLDGFSMSRPYAYLDTRTNLEGLYGKQKETGVEFQVSGKVTKDLSILGGVTWLHSSLGKMSLASAKDKNGALLSNAKVVGVPQWAADFMLDYRVPTIKQLPRLKGLAFNTNIHYVGRRNANLQGTDFASGYVTLNLGARYTAHIYNHSLIFRFNVDNVTGEKYWGSIFANGPSSGGVGKSGITASAGMPRTWHFSSSVYF